MTSTRAASIAPRTSEEPISRNGSHLQHGHGMDPLILEHITMLTEGPLQVMLIIG